MDITHSFRTYFEMLAADSGPLKEEVFKLRYLVYCIETGFESPDEFPDGLESDEYDDASEHYLVRHLQSGEYAATTRLILPDQNHPERLFPIEQHCAIERQDIIAKIPRLALGEVSRFCVSKSFKRRKGEQGSITGISENYRNSFSEQERRSFPHITLALIACLLKISQKHHISFWYAVMEPALIRFLRQLGIYFIPAGPLIDYHGNRQPCVIEVAALLDGTRQKNPEAFEMLISALS